MARDGHEGGAKGALPPLANFKVVQKCNKSRFLIDFGVKFGNFGPGAFSQLFSEIMSFSTLYYICCFGTVLQAYSNSGEGVKDFRKKRLTYAKPKGTLFFKKTYAKPTWT